MTLITDSENANAHIAAVLTRMTTASPCGAYCLGVLSAMVFCHHVLIPETVLDAIACVDNVQQGLERVKAVYEFREGSDANPA